MAAVTTIDNPYFSGVGEIGADRLVFFKVGYYEQPPKNVIEAQSRVGKALAALTEDIRLMRGWSGNVPFYHVCSKLINPDITDEMSEAMKAASLAAFPGTRIVDSWRCADSGGVSGFTVRLRSI